jgi:hypothetical protein
LANVSFKRDSFAFASYIFAAVDLFGRPKAVAAAAATDSRKTEELSGDYRLKRVFAKAMAIKI